MTLTESEPTTPIEPAAEHAPGDREMTMLEHLDELRQRLVASVIAVVAGIVVALIPIPGYGSITENAEAIRNRQAVAMGWFTTVPASFMLDLGTSMKLRMISVPDEIIYEQMLPRFREGDLPNGIEAGVDSLIAQFR